MSQSVNNFFENLTNSTAPKYAGVPPPVHTPTPSNLEGTHQTLQSASTPTHKPFGEPFSSKYYNFGK